MPAAVTDKFRKGAAAFSTTLASQKAAAASSCTLSSGTGLPTDTAVDLTIGRVDSSGTATPSKKAVYKATISGTTASNLTLVEGTDQLHEAGTVVEVTFTAETHNDMVDGLLVEHNQDGTHAAVTADSVTTDTINEETATNGVTIDGLNIKDSKLNTNNSVVTANITDAAVTDVKWRNNIAFYASRSATRTISAATFTNILAEVERFDLGSNYDTSTGLFTAPVAGIYHFDLAVNLEATASTRGILRIVCSTAGSRELLDIDGTRTRNLAASLTVDLVASETVEFQAWATNSTNIASGETWVAGYLVTRT